MRQPIILVYNITLTGYIYKADNIANNINIYCEFKLFGKTKKIKKTFANYLYNSEILAIFYYYFW